MLILVFIIHILFSLLTIHDHIMNFFYVFLMHLKYHDMMDFIYLLLFLSLLYLIQIIFFIIFLINNLVIFSYNLIFNF
jgi:hypothetical protein